MQQHFGIASLFFGMFILSMFPYFPSPDGLIISLVFGIPLIIIGGLLIITSVRILFARDRLIIDFTAGEMINYTSFRIIGNAYSKERVSLSLIDAIDFNQRLKERVMRPGWTYYTCEIKDLLFYGDYKAAKTLTIFLAKKLQKDILDSQANLRIPYDQIDESEWTKFFP